METRFNEIYGNIIKGENSVKFTPNPKVSSQEGVGDVKITLSYEGYETKAYYPDNGEELFFVMNATEGNQLLILTYQQDSSRELLTYNTQIISPVR